MAGQSILVLDDDARFLESFEDLLTQDGHAVYAARRGLEAIEIARRVPLDLSFLDFDLPDQNGIDVFTRIQFVRVECQWPELPAIFVSGSPSAVLEDLVREVGGFALLRKTFDAAQVRVVMREVFVRNQRRG